MFGYETEKSFNGRLIKYEMRGESQYRQYVKVELKGCEMPTHDEVTQFGYSLNYWGGQLETHSCIEDKLSIVVSLYKD